VECLLRGTDSPYIKQTRLVFKGLIIAAAFKSQWELPQVPFSYSYEKGCQRQNIADTIRPKQAFTGYKYFRDFLKLNVYTSDGFECF